MSELEEKKKKRSKKGGTKDGKGSKSKGYSLRDWFKGGGWVQVGGKYDGKPCAKQPGQKTKPYCRDPDDRSKMSKKEKEKRARKKRKEDPNPNRKGKAKNVKQGKSKKSEAMEISSEEIRKIILEELQQVLDERSRKKRKTARKRKKAKTTKKDACYRKVKSRYKVWPSAYASGALVKCRKVGAKNWGNKSKKNESLNEEYINEEEMSDKDRKELERIRDKLYGASKAHKGQADDLDKILKEEELEEAVYNGKTVKLNKPMRGDVKKFKVYVNSGKKDAKGRIKAKKVNFGHGGTSAKRKGEKTMKIRKSNPKARKNFRARHNCDNPGPKTKARYWSCRKW